VRDGCGVAVVAGGVGVRPATACPGEGPSPDDGRDLSAPAGKGNPTDADFAVAPGPAPEGSTTGEEVVAVVCTAPRLGRTGFQPATATATRVTRPAAVATATAAHTARATFPGPASSPPCRRGRA
jgi:hypothetical protein